MQVYVQMYVRPTLSRFWNLRIRPLSFLNYVMSTDFEALKLSNGGSGATAAQWIFQEPREEKEQNENDWEIRTHIFCAPDFSVVYVQQRVKYMGRMRPLLQDSLLNGDREIIALYF